MNKSQAGGALVRQECLVDKAICNLRKVVEQLPREFIGLQAEASKRLLTSFFNTGVGDDSLFTHQPVNFHVGPGYPALAKLGLASIVLVIVGLVALLWFIVRRVRRRKASQVSSQ